MIYRWGVVEVYVEWRGVFVWVEYVYRRVFVRGEVVVVLY